MDKFIEGGLYKAVDGQTLYDVEKRYTLKKSTQDGVDAYTVYDLDGTKRGWNYMHRLPAWFELITVIKHRRKKCLS